MMRRRRFPLAVVAWMPLVPICKFFPFSWKRSLIALKYKRTHISLSRRSGRLIQKGNYTYYIGFHLWSDNHRFGYSVLSDQIHLSTRPRSGDEYYQWGWLYRVSLLFSLGLQHFVERWAWYGGALFFAPTQNQIAFLASLSNMSNLNSHLIWFRSSAG